MARRLAVCWNICEGYPTEALEAGILPDVYEATCALLKYAEKQWDPQMAKLCANLRKALKTETDAIDFRDGRLNDCDSPACRR